MRYAVAVPLLLAVVLLAAVSCGIPPIEEILPKAGIACKAQITMPSDARPGETVDVDVRIYDCKEKKPATALPHLEAT